MPSYAITSISNEDISLNDKSTFITSKINESITDFQKRETEVKYTRETKGPTMSNGNESLSVVYDTPVSGTLYSFGLQSLVPALDNLKLINNTTLTSNTEIFSSRWGALPGRRATNKLLYVENNGIINGKENDPYHTEPAIYLRSSKDFYLKNNGKITTRVNNEIYSNNSMILENENGAYLHRSNISSGNKIFILNKANGILEDNKYSAPKFFIFNEGNIGINPLAMDEYIKKKNLQKFDPRGPRTFDEIYTWNQRHLEPNNETKERYNYYVKNFYKNNQPKEKEKFIAEELGDFKYVIHPFYNSKYILLDTLSNEQREKLKEYGYQGGWETMPCRVGDLSDTCHQKYVSIDSIYSNYKYSFGSIHKPLEMHEFILNYGGSYKQYDDYLKNEFQDEIRNKGIQAKELYLENIGLVSNFEFGFDNGYVINLGEMKNVKIRPTKGLFVNRGVAQIEIFNYTGEDFTADIRNSTILEKSRVNRNNAPTRVIINPKTEIEDVFNGQGYNETLVAISDDTKTVTHNFNSLKYIDFEHLEMYGKWKLDQSDANFSKSIMFSDAIADLNGRTLNSPSVVNAENSRLNILGSGSKVTGNLTNQGVIAFPDSSKNTVFTVNKNYIGENGKLMMNVDAQLDQPEFDLLVVEGRASGTTLIDFIDTSKLAYNLVQPVRLVKTASSDDNAFALAQSDYGKYSYYLNRIEGSDESGNQYVSWYLNQKQMTAPTEPEKPDDPSTPVTPADPDNPSTPATPTDPDNPSTPVTPADPDNPSTSVTPTDPDNPSTPAAPADQENPAIPVVPNKPVQPSKFNNESVGLLSGLIAHQNLFTQTFHDRAAKDRLEDSSAAWVRVYHNNTKNRINGADARMESHSTALQLGYDFAKLKNNDRTFTLGGYTILGRSKTHADLFNPHKESVRSISKGYALGVYATLEQANWYVDSWLSFSHLNTKVTTGIDKTHYHSNALQASFESGYNQLLAATENYEYFVQPQIQVIYHHLFKSNLKNDLKLENNKYLTTRLGVRFYQKFLTMPNMGEPYLALNWWNNTNQVGVLSGDNLVSVKGSKNIKHIEIGVDKWKITNNLSLWTNMSYFHGTYGYRDIRYNVGASYKF